MGRGTSGVARGAAKLGSRDGDGRTTTRSSPRVRRGDDRAFEALYAPLPAAHPRLRARHGQGPRARRGRHAGGLRLRAAPHARDRAADRLQAVDLRDRQERLHRRFRRSTPRRGGLLRRRRRASRPPTTAGSSAPGPTPDAAVAVKQDLDNLCGAFGGLSETHHEILVLRELEGLSYREIGERLGMSRPAVESTLFRARRRLTEEYDDLVSGARCLRIQGIIATAAHGAPRRARHPPARAPRRALPAAAAARRSPPGSTRDAAPPAAHARRREGRRAAALPDPRRRGGSATPTRRRRWAAHLASLSDQIGPGWSKAAAAAAVLLAGLGAGAGTKVVADSGHAEPAPAPRRRPRSRRARRPPRAASR